MNIYIKYGRGFLPEFAETLFQNTFKNLKLGWFICYGIETYDADGEFIWKTNPASDPTTFNTPSVDVANWAALAASYGKIDYAILTVTHIRGFSLFDHQTAIWRGTTTVVAGRNLPLYDKYDVGATSADKNIVPNFITEFKKVGIKPILYINIAANSNYYVDNTPDNFYLNADYQFAANHHFLRERLQELCRLNPFAIWIDGCLFYPSYYLREIYNCIKSINPNIGVVMNLWTNKVKTDNPYNPFDAGTTEEGGVEGILSNNTWWGLTQSYNGITYPVVKELTCTSRINSAWFWKPTPHALRSLVDLQALYDYAKAAGVPCAFSINPDNTGVIDQDQANLIGDIVL
jgi:hypothetical protein